MNLNIAVAALAFLVTRTGARRGQIIGEMNEVDENNNIVGDQPFLGMTFPSKKSSFNEKIRFTFEIFFLLAVLTFIIWILYMLYKKLGVNAAKQKIPEKKSEKISMFNDEESG